MSIERNRWGFDGEISFECDECGNELHTETANFDAALSKLRSERWQARRRGGDWEHVCDVCLMRDEDDEDDE